MLNRINVRQRKKIVKKRKDSNVNSKQTVNAKNLNANKMKFKYENSLKSQKNY